MAGGRKLKIDLKIFEDNDLSILTEKQREIIALTMNGKTTIEIATSLGCSYQNISDSLKRSAKKILNPTVKKESLPKSEKVNKNRINYENYRNSDFSILPEVERKALLLKLDGLTNPEIAIEMGTKENTIAIYLLRARKKLDGIYEPDRLKLNKYAKDSYNRNPKKHYEMTKKAIERNKEKYSEYKKEYYQNNKEYFQNYYKEYSKKYYQEHREEILQKQNERNRRKREGQ